MRLESRLLRARTYLPPLPKQTITTIIIITTKKNREANAITVIKQVLDVCFFVRKFGFIISVLIVDLKVLKKGDTYFCRNHIERFSIECRKT